MNIVRIPDRTLPQSFVDEQWAEMRDVFPHPATRVHQKEAMAMVHFALKSGFRNVILEAPVGSGKSVAAMVMGFVRGPFYALTPSLGLQRQYLSEFGSTYLKEVKGRANFICPETGETADTAPCTRPLVKGVNREPCESIADCPYIKQRNDAMRWQKGVVSNPAYMLRVCREVGDDDDGAGDEGDEGDEKKLSFVQRPLLIFDEAHNAEEQIISIFERTITTRDYTLMRERGVPPLETDEQWYRELRELRERIRSEFSSSYKRLEAIKTAGLGDGRESEDAVDRLEKLESLFQKVESTLGLFTPKVDRLGAVDGLDPASPVAIVRDDGNRGTTVRFRPVRVNKIAPAYWDMLGAQRIFVSATMRPFERFCDDLGLKREETFVVSVTESPFPLDHRLVHCLKVGMMSRARIEKTLPRQLEVIREIVDAHRDERGVILPFTHKIREATAGFLREHCPGRVITHDSSNERMPCPACGFDTNPSEDSGGLAVCPHCSTTYPAKHRDYVIKKFEEETDGNHILISTYVGEGFDLGGKKNVKFLVIQKVPYPDLGSDEIRNRVILEQNEYRKRLSAPCDFEGEEGGVCQNWRCRACMEWYNTQAVRKIQQMCGRIVRRPEDDGKIYVLDTSFNALFNRCRDMFSEYFQEAVRVVDVKK